MAYRQIRHVDSGNVLVPQARWCDNFLTNLRGFTFRRHLAENEGLVLVQKGDSRANSSIHMLFVFFDLGVIWVNEAGEVVDSVVAKAWRPYYAPAQPACYVIEGAPDLVTQVSIGDKIEFLTL